MTHCGSNHGSPTAEQRDAARIARYKPEGYFLSPFLRDSLLRLIARGPVPVDNCCQIAQDRAMSRQTMSFALPESMREYIDNRVSAGNYGNTSEYIRDLVRRDQEEQARKRLRDLIEAGLASGPGRRRTRAKDRELLAIARGKID
jgi:antitoxin ParD1/3/4